MNDSFASIPVTIRTLYMKNRGGGGSNPTPPLRLWRLNGWYWPSAASQARSGSLERVCSWLVYQSTRLSLRVNWFIDSCSAKINWIDWIPFPRELADDWVDSFLRAGDWVDWHRATGHVTRLLTKVQCWPKKVNTHINQSFLPSWT